MMLIRFVEEAAHAFDATPWIAAAIAFGVFLLLGIITWSYRDVANRHAHKVADNGGHDAHEAGHPVHH